MSQDRWQGFLAWLEHTDLGEAVRMLPQAYPLLEALHILGIALLIGPAIAVDLRLIRLMRLMGLGGRIVAVTTVTRNLLPLCHAGFAAVAFSGALMFAGIARQAGFSAAAPWKFGLILLAGANIAVFHFGIYRSVHDWDRNQKPPGAARAAGAISALSWIGALIAGRYLAYV
jgi:hypothetical protein